MAEEKKETAKPVQATFGAKTPPPEATRLACDTWLFSKEHPAGKLFLAGDEQPDMTVFVDTPAKL